MPINKSVVILVADDDAEDRQMIFEALQKNNFTSEIKFVEDGVELLDYLHQQGKYKDPQTSPRPGLILLDLNMPKKDGLESLKEIKENQNLKNIPVVVLTTSKAEKDVERTYSLGVNSFIIKPITFDALLAITRDLGRYWFEVVELPTHFQKPLVNRPLS